MIRRNLTIFWHDSVISRYRNQEPDPKRGHVKTLNIFDYIVVEMEPILLLDYCYEL